jgi:hypothetical protein
VQLGVTDRAEAASCIADQRHRRRCRRPLAQLDGRSVALLLGSEAAGVSDVVLDAADLLVAIPMAGQLLAGLSQAERRGLRGLLERVRRNAESLLREPGK